MADDRDEGVPWDGSTWVDVGDDDQWRPSFEERARALVLLLVVLGVLFVAAAVASIDDGDGDEDVTAAVSSTTTTEATTTTTAAAAPESLDGEPPPPGCESDDRDANALRDRATSSVLVLNGTPRGGHAGEVTDALEELGYDAMEPDNADIRDETVVGYLPGFCAEADRIVTDLGIATATFEPMAEDTDVFLGRAQLLVTLGRDSL